MGLNVFTPIPVPLGDGIGAEISVVGQGLKTFIIGGVFNSTVIIEALIGGQYATIARVDRPAQIRDVPIICEEVRVRIVNHRSGQADVIVGGAPVVTTFGLLDIPSFDGAGIPLDTSLFGIQKSIIVGNEFNAKITFEAGEDIAGPWSPFETADRSNTVICRPIVSKFIRAVVSNYVSGNPLGGVGSADLLAGTDELVAATVDDVSPSYLASKLEAGANIALLIVNPGGNEKVQIINTSPPPPLPSIFGNDYQSVSNSSRLTTAGAMFITHGTLTTPAGLVGRYRVSGRALVDSAANMQCQLENITDGGQLGGRGEYSPLSGNDRIAWSAEEVVSFIGLAKTFSIQFRDDPPPGATAGMSFSFLELFRVA